MTLVIYSVQNIHNKHRRVHVVVASALVSLLLRCVLSEDCHGGLSFGTCPVF